MKFSTCPFLPRLIRSPPEKRPPSQRIVHQVNALLDNPYVNDFQRWDWPSSPSNKGAIAVRGRPTRVRLFRIPRMVRIVGGLFVCLPSNFPRGLQAIAIGRAASRLRAGR